MKRSKLFFALTVVLLVLVTVFVTVTAQGPDGSGWWATFTIQNATSENANVVVTAYHEQGGAGTTYSSNFSLPGDYSVIYNPGLSADCTNPVTVSGCRIGLTPALPAGFEGSAVVSSDKTVYAVTNINNNAVGTVGVSNGYARPAYQGIAGTIAGTTLYFPTVKNNFAGQTTAFFVQAAGANADVTITYRMNNGGVFTQNVDITANRMYAFAPTAAGVPSCNGGTGNTCLGGATVTSDTPVAGVVVEYVNGASVATYVLASRGMLPGDAGMTIVAPIMKNSYFGASTGATILNTGNTSTTVDLSFTVTRSSTGCGVAPGHTTSETVTIGAGQSIVVSQTAGNTGDLDNPANRCVYYAMTAESNTHPIVVTVNENGTLNGAAVKTVYSAFNTDNATDTVYVPLYKEYFVGQTSSVTVVNAGASDTKFRATFTSSTGSTHLVETTDPVARGAAANFFNLSGGQTGFTAISGGMPAFNTKHSVVIEAVTAGIDLVAVIQESDRNGAPVLDTTNYEGFNQ
jgi:hypothetical protein